MKKIIFLENIFRVEFLYFNIFWFFLFLDKIIMVLEINDLIGFY